MTHVNSQRDGDADYNGDGSDGDADCNDDESDGDAD